MLAEVDDELLQIEEDILRTQKRTKLANYPRKMNINFEIICKDGKTIPVNKTLLSASCDYFNNLIALLKNDVKNIEFEGSYAAALIIVNYLHGNRISDKLVFTFPLLSEVIFYTHEMRLESLWDYCYIMLVSFYLNVERFFEIWNITKMYGATKHDTVIVKFGANNFESIALRDYLVEFDSHTLKSFLLLSNRIKDCHVIVHAIVRWKAADPIRREIEAEKLMQIIPIEALPTACLKSLNDYVSDKNLETFCKMVRKEISNRESKKAKM